MPVTFTISVTIISVHNVSWVVSSTGISVDRIEKEIKIIMMIIIIIIIAILYTRFFHEAQSAYSVLPPVIGYITYYTTCTTIFKKYFSFSNCTCILNAAWITIFLAKPTHALMLIYLKVSLSYVHYTSKLAACFSVCRTKINTLCWRNATLDRPTSFEYEM